MTDYEKLIIEKYKKGELRKFSPILNIFKEEIRTMLNIGCTNSIIMEYIEFKTGLELAITTFPSTLYKFKKANEIYFEKKEISEKPEQSPTELKNETKDPSYSGNKRLEEVMKLSKKERLKRYGVDEDRDNERRLKKKQEDDKLKEMLNKKKL